ncbi:MAG TPA: Rieske (2Fe-2S) protein [Chthonomonadaceae bacterium]|nr:Rieske (2Fe-2S) protein [Chthonomonadaceae bacterium]
MRKVRYPVATVADLRPDVGKTVALGDSGVECTLFYHEGRYYAVGSLCPHQNAPLEGAPVERGQILCRRHGYRFDLKTGDCTTLGGYGLPVYTVEVEGDTLVVSTWKFD